MSLGGVMSGTRIPHLSAGETVGCKPIVSVHSETLVGCIAKARTQCPDFLSRVKGFSYNHDAILEEFSNHYEESREISVTFWA